MAMTAEQIVAKHNATAKPAAGPGHNSGKAKIREFVDRIERLEDEKKAIGQDISDVKKEAKNAGFNPKMISAALRAKKVGKSKYRAEQEEFDLYLDALDFLN